MTRIPDVENAYVEAKKILDYLLNLSHEEGGPKARFFIARGFSRASWQGFAGALVTHARSRDVTEAERTDFGMKHDVTCTLHTLDGTNPCIISVWESREGQHPRCISAYPA